MSTEQEQRIGLGWYDTLFYVSLYLCVLISHGYLMVRQGCLLGPSDGRGVREREGRFAVSNLTNGDLFCPKQAVFTKMPHPIEGG